VHGRVEKVLDAAKAKGFREGENPARWVLPGGFPLVEGGKLIGAIGCSGGTGDQDTQVCKVGVDMIK